ncbi:MAG: hypothetical protein F4X02_05260 [Chloroflexi bacterium]|nr:hypothetical protein [Chloroflexota bacterium]
MPRFLPLYRAMSASVVEAFCCSNPLINAALHVACAPFILELTRLGLKMEGMIARDGDLKGACAWLVGIGAAGIRVHGADGIPLSGPLLFVANHAGLGDAHALLMSSPRRDTRVLAHDFGILPALPEFRRHVIVVDAVRPEAALRASLRHLRAGGSLLLYPRGEIEADPGLDLELALASLPAWSDSISLFARHVPGLAVVPAAAGGVLSRRALRNPLVRRYRDRDKRHFLAATFQMMFACYRDPLISVYYGRALQGGSAEREHAVAQMAALLARVHAEQSARPPD